LFQYLARNIRESQILLIGAYRPEDLGDIDEKTHPLKGTIIDLKREGIIYEIELKRLDYEESSEMIMNNPEGIQISEDFTSFIYKESDGNPFYIEELLDITGKEIPQHNPFEIEIPRTIRDIIVRRAYRLEDDYRDVLDVCSVMGERFDVDGVLDVIDRDDEDVIDSISGLCKARFIEEVPSGENVSYKFHHCKIQEVVYSEMNKVKRRMIHEKIARNLEEANKDNLKDIINELAHHYQNTKDYRKIYEYSLKAGDKANRIYSYDEALAHYKTALIALENIKGTPNEVSREESSHESSAVSKAIDRPTEYHAKKKDLLRKIGSAYSKISRWDDCIGAFDKLLKLPIDVHERANAISNIGDCYIRKRWFNKAIKICKDNIEILPCDCKEKCALILCIGLAFWHKGDVDKAYEYFLQGLEIAEKINDERVMATAYNDIARFHNFRNDHQKAIEFCRKSLDIWKKYGDRRQAGIINNNLGCCYVEIGKLKKAIDCFDEAMKFFEEIGDEDMIGRIRFNLGNLYYRIGDDEKAFNAINESIRIYAKIGDLAVLAASWHRLGMILIETGEIDKAMMYLERSLEVCKKINLKQRELADIFHGLAICEIERDNLSKALEYCENALEASRRIGTRDTEAAIFTEYGRIYMKMGAWDSSIKSFEEALNILKEIDKDSGLGDVHYFYALMWNEKGDKKNAEKHFNLALEIFIKFELEKKVESIKQALDEL
jgi:tetratricopeptide (TPR) repeat protein